MIFILIHHCRLLVRTVSVVDDEVWNEVRRRITKEFGEKNVDNNVLMVRECLKKRDHITVFQQTGGSSGKDIDVAILRALLKGSFAVFMLKYAY